MNRKQAQEALKALDALPLARNWRERRRKAQAYARLHRVRPKPAPIYDESLPF